MATDFSPVRNFESMCFQFPELGVLSLAIMISLITGGIDLSIISVANLAGLAAAFILARPSATGASSLRRPCSWLVPYSSPAACSMAGSLATCASRPFWPRSARCSCSWGSPSCSRKATPSPATPTLFNHSATGA